MGVINLGDRIRIGDGERCFVIAEVGANHNRSLSLAMELIDAAAEAGADAVKFQIYSAESLYSRRTPRHSGYSKDLFSLIKEIETPRDWLPHLAERCVHRGVVFFATPFDFQAVDELDQVSPIFKIASFEIVDIPLIRYCASKGKPMIISTGLATMEEIEDAYMACVAEGNRDVAFLQCASAYPASPAIMNLRSMDTIRRAFGTPTGLSDHTTGIHISVAAVAMGAQLIEKHFTMDRSMEGPDHPFAIEPPELREMVKQIRDVESAMGDGRKLGPSKEEMEFYEKARRSIHAAVDIPAGSRITQDMITVKRPGYGIRPKFMRLVLGREAKTDIAADQWITWEMI